MIYYYYVFYDFHDSARSSADSYTIDTWTGGPCEMTDTVQLMNKFIVIHDTLL